MSDTPTADDLFRHIGPIPIPKAKDMNNDYDHVIDKIPTNPDNPYPLGRSIINHDPRNYDFRALVQPPPKSHRPGRSWYTRDVYDQGRESSCAAQAAVGICRTSPLRTGFSDWPAYDEPAERNDLYRAAQQVDPWPGASYEGTSTDAPFRVLRDRGHIAAWHWLFGETELWDYVTWYGPAVVGTLWLDAMFSPDAKGYIHPEGGLAGGHAYRVTQAHPTRHAYRIVNSWGRGWGQNGRAWMTRADMASLLERKGEAVTVG